MKHEHTSLLMFGAAFLVIGYIYEAYYSPAAKAQQRVTQLQAPGPGATTIGALPTSGSDAVAASSLQALTPYDEAT